MISENNPPIQQPVPLSKVIRQQRLALVLVGLAAGVGSLFVFLIIITGVYKTPVSSLPGWYWVLLVLIVGLLALPVVIISVVPVKVSRNRHWLTILAIAADGLMMLGLAAFSFYFWHGWNGISVFVAALGALVVLLTSVALARLRGK